MARNLTWCLKRTIFFTNSLNICRQHIRFITPSSNVIQRSYTEKTSIDMPSEFKGINLDYDEAKDFETFIKDSMYGKNGAIDTLMKILDVTKTTAKQAIDENPNFNVLSKAAIYKNFQLLREAKMYKSTIKDNTFLLASKTDTLKQKIKIIQRIDVDINEAAYLFNISVTELLKFEHVLKVDATYLPSRHRIQYLSEKLCCDVHKVCSLITYNPFMLKLPAPKLLSVTEYILGVGMKPEHVQRDLQIYRYSIDLIQAKVERAIELKTKELKPWVVRCPISTWSTAERRSHEIKTFLKPNETFKGYIANLFGCSLEAVEFLTAKHPAILIMSLQKLTDMINLLRCRGYRIEHVQRTPGIMHRKFKTIRHRLIEWEKLSDKPLLLSQLVAPSNKFEQMLEKQRAANEIKS